MKKKSSQKEGTCMKILAVDYGDSRTGLATCDRTEFLTTPITPQITVKARNKVASQICAVAADIQAELIVIGLPLNMDGTEGSQAKKCRRIAGKIAELWGSEPVMWDERQTTISAAAIPRSTFCRTTSSTSSRSTRASCATSTRTAGRSSVPSS